LGKGVKEKLKNPKDLKTNLCPNIKGKVGDNQITLYGRW
jgi:hypothetical protein